MADPVVICENDGDRLELGANPSSDTWLLLAWYLVEDGAIGLPREALANLALALLPHLTGDEVAKVYNALPVTAGAWEPHYAGPRRYSLSGTSYRAIVSHDGNAWKTETWAGGYQATWHETLRAAQAACDARLEAAGVRLCGERVREEGT